MNAENHFINTFRSSRTHIGDDGAYVGDYVYSKDLFFENVHFKRQWFTPYQIGYKAMIVNISDAVAMNALPKYALLGVAMPRSMSLHQMDELSRGMQEAAAQFGIEIIGGDTIGNTKLDISVTIVSEAKQVLLRKGLKKGDILAYTGEIGKSQKQLRYLLAGGKMHTRSRFAVPVLRQNFIRTSRRYLRSGMDISDGLFSDIGKLCEVNRVGIRFTKKIVKNMGCSGEEYEMLIAFSPRNFQKIKRLSALTRTPIVPVAKVIRGKYINRCKAHHF